MKKKLVLFVCSCIGFVVRCVIFGICYLAMKYIYKSTGSEIMAATTLASSILYVARMDRNCPNCGEEVYF